MPDQLLYMYDVCINRSINHYRTMTILNIST